MKGRREVTGRSGRILSRTVRAMQESTRILSDSHHLVAFSRQLRRKLRHRVTAIAPGAGGALEITPSSSNDGLIVCTLIAYTPSLHEVRVTIAGHMCAAASFIDPVEATDEVQRLRQMFLDPVHDPMTPE